MNERECPHRVLLINMPFGLFDIPALSLGLLKAGLEERGMGCDVRHFTIPFAEIIGSELYLEITHSAPRYLIGERVFAHALFDRDPVHQGDQFDDLRDRSDESFFRPEKLDALLGARDRVDEYLDDCMTVIPWEQYQIIGFSSNFQQNVAALALARRIKEILPDKVIVFGGANCEGEMGLELHRQFTFVDYVFRGDGDDEFPLLVECLLAGEQIPRIPGLVLRRNGKTVPLGNGALPVRDLDSLPYPDFTDYFEQLEASSLDFAKPSALPFEASRGCWYGVKRQCTFCGYNGGSLLFRKKSSERVRQEIVHLISHYGVHQLYATDSILDQRYFQDLIPSLAESKPEWSIFFEAKANLTKDQLRLLIKAGIDKIQPGIESLSSSILELMRKGCTVLQNVQLLKWASELGVDLFWNILTDLPGEDPREYNHMIQMIPSLIHLQPPLWIGRLQLDRFSPYFNDPEGFGLTNVQPAFGYKIVYPFSTESLARLANNFDFDYSNGGTDVDIQTQLRSAGDDWRSHYSPGALTTVKNDRILLIFDQRPGAGRSRHELEGWEREAYEYCDAAHSIQAIHRHLCKRGYEITEDSLRRMLEEWVALRLMVRDGDWYLSLAVQADEFFDQVGDSGVIKQAFAGALAQMADMYRKERIQKGNAPAHLLET